MPFAPSIPEQCLRLFSCSWHSNQEVSGQVSQYLWALGRKVLSDAHLHGFCRLTAGTGPSMGTPSPLMKKQSSTCLSPTTTCPSTVPPWDTRQITPSRQTVSTTCEYDARLLGALCLRPWDRKACHRCAQPQRGSLPQNTRGSRAQVLTVLTWNSESISPPFGLGRQRNGKCFEEEEGYRNTVFSSCCFTVAFLLFVVSFWKIKESIIWNDS